MKKISIGKRFVTLLVVMTVLCMAMVPACAEDMFGSPDFSAATATPAPTVAPTPAPTEVPATEAPATEVLVAEVPATEAPATEAPATEAPTAVVTPAPIETKNEVVYDRPVTPSTDLMGIADSEVPNLVVLEKPMFGYVMVTNGYVNLRMGPDKSYDRMTKLHQGDIVNVVAKAGSWLKVTFDKYTGYVDGYFVYLMEDADTVPPENIERTEPAVDDVEVDEPETEAPVTDAPATEAPATEVPATEAPADVIEYATPVDAYIYVESGFVNLRMEPSTESPRVEKMHNGDALKLLAKVGDWYKVQFDNYTGYVDGAFVALTAVEAPATEAPVTEVPVTEVPATEAPVTETPTEEPATEAPAEVVEYATPVDAYVYVENGFVNLRLGPNADYPRIEKMHNGDTVKVLAKEGSWYKVQFENYIGYVDSAFVTVSPVEVPTTEAPATEVPVTEAPATETPEIEAPTKEVPTEDTMVPSEPATETPTEEQTEVPSQENADTSIETFLSAVPSFGNPAMQTGDVEVSMSVSWNGESLSIGTVITMTVVPPETIPENATFIWQYRKNGSEWIDVATGSQMELLLTLENYCNTYRVVMQVAS